MGAAVFRVLFDGAIEPGHRLLRLSLGHAAQPVELQSPHDAVISRHVLGFLAPCGGRSVQLHPANDGRDDRSDDLVLHVE